MPNVKKRDKVPSFFEQKKPFLTSESCRGVDFFRAPTLEGDGACLSYTPPKTNMEPENGPFVKEIPIGNHHLQVPC